MKKGQPLGADSNGNLYFRLGSDSGIQDLDYWRCPDRASTELICQQDPAKRAPGPADYSSFISSGNAAL